MAANSARVGQTFGPAGRPAPRSSRAGNVSHNSLAPVAAATRAGRPQRAGPAGAAADEERGRLARLEHRGGIGDPAEVHRRHLDRLRRWRGLAAVSPNDTSAGRISVAHLTGRADGGRDGVRRVGRQPRRSWSTIG